MRTYVCAGMCVGVCFMYVCFCVWTCRRVCQVSSATACRVSLGSTARMVPVPVTAPPACTEDSVWRRKGEACSATAHWVMQAHAARSATPTSCLPLSNFLSVTFPPSHFSLPLFFQVVVDLCNPNPCHQGVPCRRTEGGYLCACPEGYHGNECMSLKDTCHGQQCPGMNREGGVIYEQGQLMFWHICQVQEALLCRGVCAPGCWWPVLSKPILSVMLFIACIESLLVFTVAMVKPKANFHKMDNNVSIYLSKSREVRVIF